MTESEAVVGVGMETAVAIKGFLHCRAFDVRCLRRVARGRGDRAGRQLDHQNWAGDT